MSGKPYKASGKHAQRKSYEFPAHTIKWLETPWYKVYDTITSLDASPDVKSVLWNVYRHTNRNPDHPKYGRAWLAQKGIAKETSVPLRSVERAFATCKADNWIGIQRFRKGQGKEQVNEYWLEWGKIETDAETYQNVGDEWRNKPPVHADAESDDGRSYLDGDEPTFNQSSTNGEPTVEPTLTLR